MDLPANAPGTPHQITREEVLVCLTGTAHAELDEEHFTLPAGDSLLIPAYTLLRSPHGNSGFRAMAILPVGGQVVRSGQPSFTPPWAA